jgi:hypothetical protein
MATLRGGQQGVRGGGVRVMDVVPTTSSSENASNCAGVGS